MNHFQCCWTLSRKYGRLGLLSSEAQGADARHQVTSGDPACMLHARRVVGVPLMNGSAFWATVLRPRRSVHTSGSFRLRP